MFVWIKSVGGYHGTTGNRHDMFLTIDSIVLLGGRVLLVLQHGDERLTTVVAVLVRHASFGERVHRETVFVFGTALKCQRQRMCTASEKSKNERTTRFEKDHVLCCAMRSRVTARRWTEFFSPCLSVLVVFVAEGIAGMSVVSSTDESSSTTRNTLSIYTYIHTHIHTLCYASNFKSLHNYRGRYICLDCVDSRLNYQERFTCEPDHHTTIDHRAGQYHLD